MVILTSMYYNGSWHRAQVWPNPGYFADASCPLAHPHTAPTLFYPPTNVASCYPAVTQGVTDLWLETVSNPLTLLRTYENIIVFLKSFITGNV